MGNNIFTLAKSEINTWDVPLLSPTNMNILYSESTPSTDIIAPNPTEPTPICNRKKSQSRPHPAYIYCNQSQPTPQLMAQPTSPLRPPILCTYYLVNDEGIPLPPIQTCASGAHDDILFVHGITPFSPKQVRQENARRQNIRRQYNGDFGWGIE